MNILLVDDEMLEIEGLQATVDFRELGFQEILTASNIRQAKEVMTSNPVQVMICDIEMPQGDGLELLEWVRTYYPKTECVFLTCHADFRYAHKAIQLGSLDYLLKPVMSNELKSVLAKAIQKVRENDEVKEYRQFSRLWLKHQPLLVERFWLDLLNQRIPSRQDEIQKAALAIDIPGLEELKALPVLIRVQRWDEKMNLRDEKLMEFGLRNIAQEMILKEDGNGIVMEWKPGLFLVLLYLEGFSGIGAGELSQTLNAYVSACHELLKCDICCYAGMETFSFELSEMVARLEEQDKNNVSQKNRVLFLGSQPERYTDITLPNAGVWLAMLETAEGGKVIAEAEAYLDKLAAGRLLNTYTMHQLQHFFMNLFYIFSKSKDVSLHSIWMEEDVGLFEASTRTVDDMKAWVSAIVSKLCADLRKQEKSKSVVGIVKHYIAENLDKDLSCEDVAAHVFLNAIYLNRIFKKETGLALSEYMQLQKIIQAQELLSETDLPVSAIAQRVGYSNFSHFSRMFRKHTDTSPMDYRRTHHSHS